ncbi:MULTISPECIES: bifunctional glycosyltransferase/CDP-glycerol:glycerophosphate glycerophosphotransferase [Streptomycetaceae]|uniref:CDP-glycerol:polyglycerol phosphate glycero-phosphotransferase n=1 Tax=Streptantibioticus cattleyicolor (strain ATCC 35852 / DSM 46488 / JCM 4925 / NBRC 14057 / NRRL 8057) TaxID=1003195 RepID=F8JQC9_STREN|nr:MULTISPECIES: bifunctional glycosyltransferase family 2 protein/CDP-glycerol:glycerophosphate glycerophosphotransferase [Streptomycetaceae]AEW96596.1 CDP-glycerol:polyglycerol phosphate glycero-phosphotransferase [Streptantibioticus cattleyicolor NRRL 8057 = DSM 46488]MYS61092.1 glycosyltransferase [Streptomyces sp. SID5468]CCB76934.1 putative CDP-glycerol:polyglycerol phosphate glycero-phosphotransferase [Streptantibioticus cattleyicolor NRRL 8057 = DSM 46488]
MTTFSVIVTALDAQGYLRECLDSALRLPAGEVEVIGVDNGSTDATGALFDEYDERDARVTVVHLPRRLPAGAARAAGAELANGDYLLFVDGRDALVEGALEALAERVTETGRPDVVVFDHVRSHWSNSAIASGDARLFAGPGREVFSVTAHPELLHLTPTVANRLVRADFFAAHRELFTQDEYAEVLPALGSLLAADRIAAHDQICLRRSEPDTPQAAEGQFNLFPQYDALWALMDRRGVGKAHRAVVFSGMIRRYLKVLTLPGMADRDQAEFFRRASEHFLRYKPADYTRPSNLNGVRHAMLERGSYVGYRALQTANRKRRTVRSLAVKAKKKAGQYATESAYREQLRHPIEEDLAVFSAYWDRGVTCSPAAISAQLAELAPGIRQVWVVRRAGVPLVPAGIDYVVPGTRRYWSVMARAKYLVNNVNFPDSVIKRPGQIHVQTHHGTPLKRMGIDQIPFPATSRGVDYDALLERCGRWDYSVSANRHSTEIWERAYPVPFTSLDYGYPRNDTYYTATAADVRRIRERLGVAPGRKALLYAPTHRDYEATWTPRLDLERLARTLGDDFVLLVRGHYFYDRGLSPLEELHRRGVIIDVSRYDSVEELALASDALITDYSSVMFDYANLDRPVVVFADDWETYSVTRGVYFDLTELSPGAVARSQEDVERIFRSGEWRGEAAAAKRAEFRRKFCEFDDGRAAERVVRHVFLGEHGVPPVVPLAERTPAPTPEQAAAVPTPAG